MNRHIFLLALALSLTTDVINIVEGFVQTKINQRSRKSSFSRISPLQIFSDDSISNSNMKMDPVLEIPLLEAKLIAELESDMVDNDVVLDLKQQIGDAKTAAEFGVRRAQLQFYEAFARGDYEAMADVWSKKHPVSCVHPCQNRLEGYDVVMQSWKEILAVSGLAAVTSFESDHDDDNDDDDDDDEYSFRIEPANVQMEICGSTAIVSCLEQTGSEDAAPLEAVNIYKRENGNWKMTMVS